MTDSSLLEQLNRYYNLWRESTLMYEEWSKRRGLSYNSVMVLYSIVEAPDTCTQKKIHEKWLLPKQTINTILKEFERRDLITLSPLPTDKRNKLIHPTASGQEYAQKIISDLRELELYVLETLGLERVSHMNRDLSLFIELFHKGEEMQHAQT